MTNKDFHGLSIPRLIRFTFVNAAKTFSRYSSSIDYAN